MRRVLALALSMVVRGLDLVFGWLRRWSGRSAPCQGVVLYYHAVKSHERSRFAWQMDELSKRARLFAAGSPEAMRADGQNVAITFDDGYRSVVENAVPELAKRGIPFTVFVPSGCLGKRPSWVHDPAHSFWEERVVSADEVAALASERLATVGSHSVTHPNFRKLDSRASEAELFRSREELRAAAGIDVDLFSFPHGAGSAEHVDQARRAGYRRVFTIEPALVGADPGAFVLGRVAANPDDWPLEFRLKIAGAYRWRAYLHMLKELISSPKK